MVGSIADEASLVAGRAAAGGGPEQSASDVQARSPSRILQHARIIDDGAAMV